MGHCPLCGGNKEKGFTVFTVELGGGLLIVKGVPANICSQCGEKWITSDVAEKLEKIADDARKKKPELEIVSFEEAA
ncbi:MAG: type II toxin-antitoxin system MqsA family antitoxin [Candidatus Dadabacteria bacterium]|nr:type II toxin-antitoxin system MqsA family antitoxin [Candidatus Dadabacteria bacterium]